MAVSKNHKGNSWKWLVTSIIIHSGGGRHYMETINKGRHEDECKSHKATRVRAPRGWPSVRTIKVTIGLVSP